MRRAGGVVIGDLGHLDYWRNQMRSTPLASGCWPLPASWQPADRGHRLAQGRAPTPSGWIAGVTSRPRSFRIMKWSTYSRRMKPCL
jgi:hypothetical protein